MTDSAPVSVFDQATRNAQSPSKSVRVYVQAG